jgi:hypothetical protein
MRMYVEDRDGEERSWESEVGEVQPLRPESLLIYGDLHGVLYTPLGL